MVVKSNNIHEWHKVFVIFPRITVDNKIVFLQKVNRKWNEEKYGLPDCSGHSIYQRGWDYKL